MNPSFIKFIHRTKNRFSVKLNKKPVQNWQIMQSTWQTGVANGSVVFSGGSLISDIYTKMAVRKY